MKKLLLTLTLATIFSVANAQQATPCDGFTYSGDNSGYGMYFTNFTTSGGLTNIANNSSYNSEWSSNDFRSTQVLTSWADGPVIFSATIANPNFGPNVGWGVWIDEDNDGAFSDAEKAYYADNMTGGTVTGTTTIPSTLAEGNYNLRIVMDYVPGSYYNIDTEGACGTTGIFSTGFNFYGEVEDYTLTVGPAPACFVPTDITLTASTTTTADFTFTDSNDPVTNDYEYQLIDVNAGETFDDDAAADGTTTTTSIGLTSLTPANYYSVRVRTTCPGDDSATDWSVALDFNTTCSSDLVTAIDEDFDATSNMPVCFDTALTTEGYASVSVLTSGGASGTNNIRLRKFTSTEEALLILPSVSNITDNHRLTFNVKSRANESGSVFNVGTVDDTGVFTSFEEITITGTWNGMSIDFSTYSGTDNTIAIAAAFNSGSNTAGSYSDTFVDDVVWEQIPSCFSVSNINYTSAGTDGTSSDISWTGNGTTTNHNIEVYAAGADTSTATAVYTEAVVGATSTTVTGLTAYTYYDVYVQADCGFSGQAAFVMQQIYTGHCDPASDNIIVYIDDFTTSGGDTNISNTGSGYSTGGYGDFRDQSITGLYATQSFDIDVVSPQYGGSYHFWVDWNNDLSFDNTSGSSEFAGTIASVLSGTITVTIPAGQTAGDYVLRVILDNDTTASPDPCSNIAYGEFEDYTVSVVETPSCLVPDTLASTNVLSTTADLSWNEVGSATSHTIYVYTSGADPASATPVYTTTVSGTTADTASGLTSNTAYDFYVVAVCSVVDESSLQNTPGTFTTTAGCDDSATFCYEGGLTKQSSASSVGDFITVTINSGSTETDYDNLVIYDSLDNSGNVLYNANGDHTGVLVTSTTGLISVYTNADGSWDCDDGSGDGSEISLS